MFYKWIRTLFLGNYFIGILAVALSIEASLQLGYPLGNMAFYTLIFCFPIAYYNFAYIKTAKTAAPNNPRTAWFIQHKRAVKISQISLISISSLALLYLSIQYANALYQMPLSFWLAISGILAVGILYYGLLPKLFAGFHLRNSGWLKPLTIGFLWACTANALPLFMQQLDNHVSTTNMQLWAWLFIKNWMFCTVNAIMFDIKDYEVDMNKQLKTLVVRWGISNTIAWVILPLLVIGLSAFLVFASIQQFSTPKILLNLSPFVLTFFSTMLLYKKRSILFYLIVIDGLILFKAICGSLSVLLPS